MICTLDANKYFDRSVHATSDSSSNGSLTPSRTLPFNDDIWSGIMKQSISVAQRQSQAPIKHSQWYSTDASLRSAWTLRITRQCICVHPLPISTRVPSSTIPTITNDKKYDSVPTDVVLFDGPLAHGSFAAVYEGSCQLNGVITRVAVKYMIAKERTYGIPLHDAMVLVIYTFLSLLT
jgi:hypothetical protein